jgi:hypothetical protein
MPLMKYLSVLGLSFVLFGGAAHAAETSLLTSLSIGEQYNDNIYLQSSNPQHDYITEVIPSLTGHYQTPLWTWDANLSLQYLYYDIHHGNTQTNPSVYVRNLTNLWDPYLHVETIEDYRKVSQSVVNNFANQSPFVNQTEQNTLTLHPYLTVTPFQNTTLQYGHKFIDYHYNNGSGINRIDNIDYLESYINISSRMTFTVGVRLTREENNVNDYDQSDVYTGLVYRYSENSSIFGLVTKSWIDYQIGQNQNYWGWDAGLNHHIAEYTIKLETASVPIPDPSSIGTRQESYQATVSRDTPRSNISVGYTWSDYKNGQLNETTSTSGAVQGSLMWRFTPRLSGTATSLYQETNDKATNSYIYLSQSSLRSDYKLTEKITMSLWYTYIHSYAPVITTDDYKNNQANIQFTMTF